MGDPILSKFVQDPMRHPMVFLSKKWGLVLSLCIRLNIEKHEPTRFPDASATLRCDGFVESRRACLALGLRGGRAAYNGVLAWRAPRVDSARVSLSLACRRGGFKKSGCTRFAQVLRGRCVACISVFAGGAQS